MSTQRRPWVTTPRFMPLVGMLVGAVGGGVYWIGTMLWPASIAVILAMIATTMTYSRALGHSGTSAPAEASARSHAAALGIVFEVLVKYNALMALSAANLPFALPANLALGVIMIAGIAASQALLVSASPSPHADLVIALVLGFAPAALIGIPGLVGLVAAIAARFVFVAYLHRRHLVIITQVLDITRQACEVCFYLGALAAWSYI